ncbi:MAG: hypothetical protein CSA47_01695 [Gammaproteobacteria bacterium]|nr:MAG: hypothetical protein CSA47_01695 [Gammaproteobacteria bacterium]
MRPIQYFLFSLWAAVVVGFVLGVTLPIATVEKFVFFENQFSLLSSLIELASEPNGQNILLLVIITVFTFIFPIAKLATMFLQIRHYGENWQNRMTRFVETLGHFSMLDVFVIALMVLLLKLRILVDVIIHEGFYWFTASIVISILLSFTIKYLRKKDEQDGRLADDLPQK